MKIVVLNECFLNNEHLKRLKALGEVELYTDTDSEEKAIERVKDAEIIIADPFVSPLNKAVIESAPNLKLIDLSVIGYDLVDLEVANKQNVKIANIPGFSTQAVAELAIGLMLAVMRNISLADREMRKQPFEVDAGNPSHKSFKGRELKGKTLGIVGLGRIGQQTAQLGGALGMKVVGFDRNPKNIDSVEQITLEELLKVSDVVSLHLSMALELENIISEKTLSLMKPTAILINAARGKLVEEEALFKALKEGKIGGAGLDVLRNYSSDNPLLKLENVVFTPHEGYLTDGSVENMAEMVVVNVEAFVKGKPINVVNP
jgi:phosphoglycerate dehydrogenase-like enzyme